MDRTQREPLHFGASGQFFSSYNARERITLYTISGSIPAYWERLDQDLTVMLNLRPLLSPANSWMMRSPGCYCRTLSTTRTTTSASRIHPRVDLAGVAP
jgi:hypothetical protein